MTDEELFDVEMDAFQVVIHTIGENATTEAEMNVAVLLMGLMARIELMSGKTVH